MQYSQALERLFKHNKNEKAQMLWRKHLTISPKVTFYCNVQTHSSTTSMTVISNMLPSISPVNSSDSVKCFMVIGVFP